MTSSDASAEPLAIELLNTLQLVDGAPYDHLSDEASLADWFTRMSPRLSDATGRELQAADLATVGPRLRKVRDAARQLAAEALNDPRPTYTPAVGARAEAVAVLNREAAAWNQLDWPDEGQRRAVLAAKGDLSDLWVATFATETISLLTAKEPRLKPCLAPGCSYWFWKQRRQEWCSPECGNRARAARHYQRHHTRPTP